MNNRAEVREFRTPRRAKINPERAGPGGLTLFAALLLVLSGCTANSTAPSPSPTATVANGGNRTNSSEPNAATTARSEAIAVRRDGIQLAGTLEVPALAAGEKAPLVILLHGFTGSQDEPVIRASARALATQHIASLRFDFDAHGNSGGRQVDMTVPSEIEDARAMYDYARALPYVSTIGLVGHSQGGVVAAMLAGQLRDRIRALVLLAPATNIPDDARAGDVVGTRFDPSNPPESITVFGFQIGRQYMLTAQTLPVRQVPAQFTGPVSLIQGEADALIPVSQSRNYVTIFSHGELHLLPGQDHDFLRDPDQPAELAINFLNTHLR